MRGCTVPSPPATGVSQFVRREAVSVSDGGVELMFDEREAIDPDTILHAIRRWYDNV